MYPVFLDITNKEVLVFGGGEIAERKIKRLLDEGALISVVSKRFSDEILALSVEKSAKDISTGNLISLVAERDFDYSSIKEFWLVYAATGDESFNQRIYDLCTKEKVFCNTADKESERSFITPAVVKSEAIEVAVTTKGSSPHYLKEIKSDIKENIVKKYSNKIEVLGSLRKLMIDNIENADERRTRIIESCKWDDDRIRKEIDKLKGK